MPDFHEDGMICNVNVLEDNSNNEWERYTLQVINVKQHSRIYKSPKERETFSVEKVRKIACNGMWHLSNYIPQETNRKS